MKTYYSYENGGHRVMADDDDGRYTVADCMDETTARHVSFILNHEDIEQILQSHTEEQDMADKAESDLKSVHGALTNDELEAVAWWVKNKTPI